MAADLETLRKTEDDCERQLFAHFAEFFTVPGNIPDPQGSVDEYRAAVEARAREEEYRRIIGWFAGEHPQPEPPNA